METSNIYQSIIKLYPLPILWGASQSLTHPQPKPSILNWNRDSHTYKSTLYIVTFHTILQETKDSNHTISLHKMLPMHLIQYLKYLCIISTPLPILWGETSTYSFWTLSYTSSTQCVTVKQELPHLYRSTYFFTLHTKFICNLLLFLPNVDLDKFNWICT